ncbi:MAG: hypothetical protein KF784_10820 [Fimbriimonadaceae bacterium]|nr:hypothetical protein [Fimbriimonadaceae bacterium]
MSQVMEGIDARGYLAGWAQALKQMYSADVKAIPADKLNVSPGGVARSSNDLTADTVLLMNWVTEALKGNETKLEEGDYAALGAKLTTADAQIEALSSSIDAFCGALSEASDERLNSTIMAPWGMETPVYMLAQIAVSHIWYHDGQLNYIQALNGDGAVHWMDS